MCISLHPSAPKHKGVLKKWYFATFLWNILAMGLAPLKKVLAPPLPPYSWKSGYATAREEGSPHADEAGVAAHYSVTTQQTHVH